jgi:hypothetical protein
MKRSLLLPSLMGAALLAALAAPPTHAEDTRATIDGLKKAAAGLRQLAARALPSNFDQEMAPEYTKQTTWLKNAAGRCDALAKKLQPAGGKAAATRSSEKVGPDKPGGRGWPVAEEFPNLRNALKKENADFSFKSPEAKARQDEATRLLEALGQ